MNWARGTLVMLLLAGAARAENDTVFRHSDESRFWLAGQINIIHQRHGSFRSPYSGTNSLHAQSEEATSRVLTLYSGFLFARNQELLADLESAGGRGISDAAGLAGFTNLDVVRNPTLGARPYMARLMYHAVIPLSRDDQPQQRTFLSLMTRLPARRIEVRVGKMATNEFFDLNSVGSDSHLQFMNWAIDNNAAFDYAADTRGYTIGSMAEYDDRQWSLRGGIMLMPAVANGIKLDKHLRSAHGQNLEFERRWAKTTMRLLLYDNRAAMGNYRQSLALSSPPDITATRRPGRAKVGVGSNVERSINEGLRVFARAGWSDGRNESFAYTEVDRTVQVGGDVRMPHRPKDKAGIALAVNGISAAHRDYLAAGGIGFLLGDGRLTYGNETIVEAYYTARIARGLFASVDVQHISNPGYNRDRGPVWVPAARIHVDF
jgi:high affinity Mn2+ porin